MQSKAGNGTGTERQQGKMLTSSLVRKDDREQVIALFQELGLKQELTAENLVELARDEKHVLHRYFEWNDGVAAERYRKGQARQIIQSIKVRIVTEPENVISVRAIISVPGNSATGERARYALAANVNESAQVRVREQAIAEIARLRKKYSDLAHLPEFAAVFTAADKLTEK